MAGPSIIWRHPKPLKLVRCWTHVKRDANKSVYLMLESAATGPSGWVGLPTLEILRKAKGAAQKNSRGIMERLLS